MSVMMKCGCAADSTCEGRPNCIVHGCREVDSSPPDLTGRESTCGGHDRRPSSTELAFFEYQGPGSRWAVETCKCGFYRVAHERDESRVSPEVPKHCRHPFEARGPSPTDAHYCGCRGWD